MAGSRVERQLQGELYHVIKDLLSKRRISEIDVVVEKDRADILFQNVKTGKTIVFFELKDPSSPDGRSVLNPRVLQREVERSKRLGAGGFGITNFVEVFFMYLSGEQPGVDFPGEAFVSRNSLEKYRETLHLDSALRAGLEKLADYMIDRAIDVLLGRERKIRPVDETLVLLLRAVIDGYSSAIASALEEKYRNDADFKRRLDEWLSRQFWRVPTSFQDFERIAHLSLLMLTSRLIFYKAVYDSHLYDLPPLRMDEQTPDPWFYLYKNFFSYLVEKTGDFENLVGSEDDILMEVAFVEPPAGISFVKEIISAESLYDFSKLDSDVVGRVFEGLLDEEERHKMGQYFTPPEVVDCINAFIFKDSRSADMNVMDPTCGSGAFLVRAYMRKKALSQGKKDHFQLLSEIYGFDISDYAVQLATMNLAMRDLRLPSPKDIEEERRIPYPRIFRFDFFDVYPGMRLKFPHRNKRFSLPQFDAVIGNPPYTRQEELAKQEKEKIESMLKRDWREGFRVSGRTSLYALVLYHAAAFLKEKGYLGFIVSNSWLDTGYGEEMQKFLLDRFKIVAIVDSKVERFFPDADVNTSILIIRRESDEVKRDANIVRFVYLKKPLKEVMKEYGGCDALVRLIENVRDSFYETDFLRIRSVAQVELRKDNKWGKYLRAGGVYWKIMEKGNWIPLREIAEVRRGFTTGDNKFFYVKDRTEDATPEMIIAARNNRGRFASREELEERGLRLVENGYGELFLIESELLKPVVKSPREVKRYVIKPDELEYRGFLVGKIGDFYNEETGRYEVEKYRKFMQKEYPYAWQYVLWGEEQGVHTRPTTKGRPAWWDLGKIISGDILHSMIHSTRFFCPINVFKVPVDHNLFALYLKFERESEKLFYYLYLNSSIHAINLLLNGRVNLGEGALKTEGVDIKEFPVLALKDFPVQKFEGVLKKLMKEEAKSLLEYLSASSPEEIDIDKVAPIRLEIDRAVLEAIGFEDPQERDKILLELYRELVDLVKSRLEKAKSVESRSKSKRKVNLEVLADEVERRLEMEVERSTGFLRHLKEKIAGITPDEKMQKKILSILWKRFFGEDKVPSEKQLEKLF